MRFLHFKKMYMTETLDFMCAGVRQLRPQLKDNSYDWLVVLNINCCEQNQDITKQYTT